MSEAGDKKAPQKQAQKQQQQKGKGGGGKKQAAKKKKGPAFDPNTAKVPGFHAARVEAFERYKAENEAAAAAAAAAGQAITVTLPDGKEVAGVAWQSTPHSIACEAISSHFARSAVAAKVDDEMVDMFRPLTQDCRLSLYKFDSPEGQEVFHHSSAHILGQAMERLYGGLLCTGPPLEEGGFFYDMAMDATVVEEDLSKLEAVVKQIVKSKQKFERIVVTKEQALDMFRYNKYKHEILASKVPEGSTCTVYRCGDLVDPCRGPHLPDTGYAKAFAVHKFSSAYWKGDAANDSVQRVYGNSFPDTKRLRVWRQWIEEARKRDHRVIGTQQELFFFDQLSPGSCFWLPHGARIYNRLVDFIKAEYWKRGFEEVITPNVFNTDLWETSGHLAHYREDMFLFQCEEQEFAMKPMNCPGHCVMFGHRVRSHRELPMRLADFGVLHRNEASGALSGLTRVRRFQQDDAHIFCRQDQVEAEIGSCLEFMASVYGVFGFEFELALSTRPKKALGAIEVWERAEAALAAALDGFGRPWSTNPGDGAFYGPKIDIKVYDAMRRAHQCATIQLDFQLPDRFGLSYTGESGPERPVMVHRAILGSVERFVAVLTENCAGKWPFWLSPRQAIVVPVGAGFFEYAHKVRDQVHAAGFYCDVDVSGKTLDKKIKTCQEAQYNFILVVGNKEEQAGTVNVRTRDNVRHGERSIATLLEEFAELASTRRDESKPIEAEETGKGKGK